MSRTMAAWFWFFMFGVGVYALWQGAKKIAKMLRKIVLLAGSGKR